MKWIGLSLLASTSAILTALVAIIAMFVLIAYAIAGQVRVSVPIFGGFFADAIIAWLQGAAQPVAPEPVGWVNGQPIPDGDFFTGPVTARPECWRPAGAPVGGALTQSFRPPNNPAHTGIDISVVQGTPVAATMCGTVVYSAFYTEQAADGSAQPSYGYLVIIENGPYRTYYAHNTQLLVSPGQTVELGQTIALSGSTGRSSGPHVHYEVRVNGIPIDPLGALP